MKLTTTCHNCHQVLTIQARVRDRVELARKKGDQIEINCKNCHTAENYPVDELSAAPNGFLKLLSLLSLLVGTPLIIWLFWDVILTMNRNFFIFIVSGLFLLPVIIYALILKNDRDRVNAFNRHRLKGRQPRVS